ncbi:Wzz/FepE/Etk N-terminal domain-containing protein [Vibrio genomosp. F6]|uniref:Lipopolysaccharide biosynthesis protein n=1 Tax=Vibrio genomosp. F6 str. FF-238 TaxID=1191298 RepID=A0A1E5D2I0_9VIBR|nr:Wzz/FepE/Etk N-terminal domain-containing protein [Vibrio genomosp. F6]OEE77722.1 lipopolysaccharide biosynthesis protein [Vibrio genomosp. F6 str. FF-238]
MNKPTLQESNQPYPYSTQYPIQDSSDEIDLRELFVALWRGKWLIIVTTFVFAVGGVLYALSQPNTYKAEVVLASSSDGGKGGMAAMAAQFGGLASLAGINLGGGSTDNKGMSLAVLNSRQFLNTFITKHNLLVPLMATTEWNEADNSLVIDPELYDVKTEQWVREVKPGKSQTPTDWEAYKVFKKDILKSSESKDTGLVTLSVTHFSPVIAQQWAELLVQDLNAWMKEKSLNETKRNIGYLEQQLEKTNVSDMRTVFFQLIEEQTKNLMLAEVETEFAFKTVDPAVIPEEKAGPKRALICVLATLLGGMLGVAAILVRFAFRKEDELEVES